MTCGPVATETVNFIDKFDKFFDCFNVSSYQKEMRYRNLFRSHIDRQMISD